MKQDDELKSSMDDHRIRKTKGHPHKSPAAQSTSRYESALQLTPKCRAIRWLVTVRRHRHVTFVYTPTEGKGHERECHYRAHIAEQNFEIRSSAAATVMYLT